MISKKVTGENVTLFLLLPGHLRLQSQSLTCHGGVSSARGELTLPVPPALDDGSSFKCFKDPLKSPSHAHPLLAPGAEVKAESLPMSPDSALCLIPFQRTIFAAFRSAVSL